MEGAIQQEESIEKKMTWEMILDKRMRLIENPQSVVFAARTREGLILTDLIFSLDRAVSRIRMQSGTFIPVHEVTARLKRVDELIKEFQEFVESSFGDGSGFSAFENQDTKRALASLRRTLVFLPRSIEAREMTRLAKKLDPALIAFRNSCTDFSKSEEIFRQLINLILKFNSINYDLFSLLGFRYRKPNLLKIMLKATVSPASDTGEKGILGQENQEEISRKGKKALA